MSGVSKAISNNLYEQVVEDLKICGRQGDVSRKLQAIKSAKENDISLVAKIFGISRHALMGWISAYEAEGMGGLRIHKGRGRKPIISSEEEKVIAEWLEGDNTLTIQALIVRIENDLGKKIKKTATHDLMKKLGFSYITPRPKHYKQNKEEQETFKKKSARKSFIKPR
jgi:transposase